MKETAARKLDEIGLDPIVPLPLCAQAVGASTQTLKNLAKRGELEIIRVSERRCGIRRSVLDAFLESRKSAVEPADRQRPRKALGSSIAKAGRPALDENPLDHKPRSAAGSVRRLGSSPLRAKAAGGEVG